MAKRSTFVGLDVHIESIAVAFAESGRRGEVRDYGTVMREIEALEKVLRALRAPGPAFRARGLAHVDSRSVGF